MIPRESAAWTNDALAAARRLYQAAGLALISSERRHGFGNDLVGENWEKVLEIAARETARRRHSIKQ
jgi:hypothetical protein